MSGQYSKKIKRLFTCLLKKNRTRNGRKHITVRLRIIQRKGKCCRLAVCRDILCRGYCLLHIITTILFILQGYLVAHFKGLHTGSAQRTRGGIAATQSDGRRHGHDVVLNSQPAAPSVVSTQPPPRMAPHNAFSSYACIVFLIR